VLNLEFTTLEEVNATIAAKQLILTQMLANIMELQRSTANQILYRKTYKFGDAILIILMVLLVVIVGLLLFARR
jgi:hypothetical protein